MTWDCHVDGSTKVGYNMIMDRYLLTELESNLKLSKHIIESEDGNLKGSRTTMVDFSSCKFKDLNMGKITPAEYFPNDYIDEVYGPEKVANSKKKLCSI